MKRLFIVILSLLSLAGCGETGKGKLSIGDVCIQNGHQAVVVRAKSDGKSGLLMSAEDINGDWYEAQDWVASLGEGWRLPTKRELQMIYNMKDMLNAALWESGMTILSNESYWSSEGAAEIYGNVYIVDMTFGSVGYWEKNNRFFYARAVSDF